MLPFATKQIANDRAKSAPQSVWRRHGCRVDLHSTNHTFLVSWAHDQAAGTVDLQEGGCGSVGFPLGSANERVSRPATLRMSHQANSRETMCRDLLGIDLCLQRA